jgi:hypothetical protein
MGWLKSEWLRRVPVSLDNTAGGSTVDFDITIPKGLDAFWSVIDSAGAELRLTAADGETVLDYGIDNGSGGAFNAAAVTARTGRLRTNNTTVPAVANSTVLAWLYFNSSTAQGSSGGVTGTGTIAGYIDTTIPKLHRFVHAPQIPAQTRPRSTIHKRVDEEIALFVSFMGSMGLKSLPGFSHARNEEPWYATPSVLDTAGAAQAGMIDATKNRFVDAGRGRIFYKMIVKAGTTANNYTALADLRTLLPAASVFNQRLISTIGVSVRDVRY